MDKLILNNGMEVNLQPGSSLSDIKVLSHTKDTMCVIWDEMTNENLKHVQIKNEDDVLIAEYNDLILVSETSYVQENGMILTSFNIREKTEVEKLKEELDEMKGDVGNLYELHDVQDDAIIDLAETVAEMQEVQ